MLCITAFSFPASANVPENEELSVNDNVESTSPLTPGGNLTVIDDVHQVTDTSAENKIEDKQFITRIIGSADRRQMQFALTPAGEKLIKSIKQTELDLPDLLKKAVME